MYLQDQLHLLHVFIEQLVLGQLHPEITQLVDVLKGGGDEQIEPCLLEECPLSILALIYQHTFGHTKWYKCAFLLNLLELIEPLLENTVRLLLLDLPQLQHLVLAVQMACRDRLALIQIVLVAQVAVDENG